MWKVVQLKAGISAVKSSLKSMQHQGGNFDEQ